MSQWRARDYRITQGPSSPKIMGIVNVTPDSFSDGGRFESIETAHQHALKLVEQGADILDIGGESSRPGAAVVPLEEELRRVVALIGEIASVAKVPISVDTVKPAVARAAIAAGAAIINDIEAFSGKPEMFRLAAETGAGIVLMHMPGNPRTMVANSTYKNVVEEVFDYLAGRVEEAERFGLNREQIAIDPGIGFGKAFEHNLELLRNLDRFVSLGCTILIGTSRKGFLGTITGQPIGQRGTASVISSLSAILKGASVVRVHDVEIMADALKVWSAVHGWDR